jgi:hypothetical protein
MSNPDYPTSTEIPADIYRRVEELALEAAFNGDTRISTRLLLETARAELKTKVNNNVIPTLGRLLIKNNPHLDGIVKTKGLGARGKNKPAIASDLQLITDFLASHRSLTASSITVVVNESGVTRTFDVSRFAQLLRTQKKGTKN